MVTKEQQTQYVQLIIGCQQRLNAYIRTILPNSSAADDVLQETNLVLWKKIDVYEPGTNFNAWAYKIAYFQTLAYMKKTKRENWICFDTELVDILGDDIEAQSENIESESQVLKSCIEKLNVDDMLLLKQRYYEELPLKDLATKVGRSLGALKQAMFRIRGSLKLCIRKQLQIAEAEHGI